MNGNGSHLLGGRRFFGHETRCGIQLFRVNVCHPHMHALGSTVNRSSAPDATAGARDYGAISLFEDCRSSQIRHRRHCRGIFCCRFDRFTPDKFGER